jgi:HlyD family secretion protein
VDREIAPDIRRRRQLRLIGQITGALLAVAGVLLWLPAWLRPAVPLSRVRTAVVVAGVIEASLTAAGIVVPAIERVVSSPLDARVLKVLKRPGAMLAPGDPVIALDVSESAAALERAQTDLKVKENQLEQTRLGYEQSLVDLDGRIQIKSLELERRRAVLATHQQLAAKGLLSKEDLRQTELTVKQNEIELSQLQGGRTNAGRSTAVQIEGLALERETLDRDVTERRRVLDLATTKADRDGVLTWVVTEEGALVRRGDVIARIADLSAFRVEASVADIHAGRIRPGLPVHVRLDDLTIDGQVSEVYPTVENAASAEPARGRTGHDRPQGGRVEGQTRSSHRRDR